MTIDDERSIYVGGLPYDITEESLRRVFVIYGAVVAVKIINDRSIGGKCYGFVTFANPRSAMQAIKTMDGKTIDGRVVKVNEVRTRGGRIGHKREGSRHDLERGIDGNSARNHGRDANYYRSRNRDGRMERFEDRGRDGDRDPDRLHGYDRIADRYDGERFKEHDKRFGDVEHDSNRKRERDWEKNHDQNVEENRDNSHDRGVDKDRDLPVHLLNRSGFKDRENRELSFESPYSGQDQVDDKLEVSKKKIEELHEEISLLRERAEDKEDEISKLQEDYQQLEGSLMAAKQLTSFRHMQLTKLHKCYLQVRENDVKLKKYEEEFQSLLNSTKMELE